MDHNHIDVYKLNMGGGYCIPEGRYAVIKEEQWDDFITHYNEIFSEREQALDLGMKLNKSTKYNDSMVKYIRWVFSQIRDNMRASDAGVREDMPRPKDFLDKLYELKLADQSYAAPEAAWMDTDKRYEHTPVDSRWTIHLQRDLKEEHEYDDRAEESEESGDGLGEETP